MPLPPPSDQSRFIYHPPRSFRNGCSLQKMDYTYASRDQRHYKIRYPDGHADTAITYRRALHLIRNYNPMRLQ